MTSITSFFLFVCFLSSMPRLFLLASIHKSDHESLQRGEQIRCTHKERDRFSLRKKKRVCISPFLWILTLPNYKLQIPGNCLTENGEGAWKFSKTRHLLPGRGSSREQMRETQELRGCSESKAYAYVVFEAEATAGGYTDLAGWRNRSVWHCNDGSRERTM